MKTPDECKHCGKPVEVREEATDVACDLCTQRLLNPAHAGDPERSVSQALRGAVKDNCANHVDGKHHGDRACSVCVGKRCSVYEPKSTRADEKSRAMDRAEVAKQSLLGDANHSPHDAEGGPTRPKRAPKSREPVCMLCGQPLEKDDRKVCTDCRISAHRKGSLPPGAYTGPELSVLKAIHARCVDCKSDPGVDARAWARCDFDGIRQELCPLWPYRNGKNPNLRGIVRNDALQSFNALRKGLPSRKTPARPSEGEDRELERRLAAQARPLRSIRSYCLWCCMDQAHEVRLWSCVSCSLWPFRFGRRPKVTIAGCDSGAGKNGEGIERKKSKARVDCEQWQ